MSTLIPESQVQFAQLAVKQRLLKPEQVRAALELFRRYQTAGGDDIPSVPRILVQKGWIHKHAAEALLRHLIKGEPLTTAQRPPKTPEPQPAAYLNASDFDPGEDLGLEPPGSSIDLPVHNPAGEPLVEEEQAYVEGKGFAVKEIKGYKIVQILGEGAMTIVYRAHQLSMDRPVALKVLTPDKAKDQRFVEEFFAEARKAGRLNHPNLIRVHEVSNKGEVPYYSMEYVDGPRLDEMMDECEGGRLDPKLTVSVFIQASNALEYGYRQEVIHREIRPNSIMVSSDGQAKLADLGLTKGEETRFLEGENAYYVAPEQVRGVGVDTRADIYSLGCCLFHCLTGEAPFEGGTPKEVMHRRLNSPTPDPRELNDDIPPTLASIVMKMMAREINERYQTPGEVAEALKKVVFTAPTGKGKPTTKKGALQMKAGVKRIVNPNLARPGSRPGGMTRPSGPRMDRPRSARQAARDARMKKRR